MRWLLESPKDDSWLPGEPIMWLELEILAPFFNLWGGKKGGDWVQSPMANDLINHAYVMKPPYNMNYNYGV